MPASINAEMQTIRQVLKWAIKRRLINAAPEAESIPTRPVRVVMPTPEEVVRIINHLPGYLKPLIRFLAETGCRRGEIDIMRRRSYVLHVVIQYLEMSVR